MAHTQKYDLHFAIFERTYDGLQFTVTKSINNAPFVPVDLTGAVIRMEIESKKNKFKVIWGTDTGQLSIIDAVNGVFVINQQLITIPIDNYGYGIIFEFPNNTVYEYIYGDWTIKDMTPNG